METFIGITSSNISNAGTRIKMNCYIINFNRLKWTKQLAIDLADRGFTPIILDNNSSYPPLLDWYNSSEFKFKLVKFDRNHGHRAFYHSGFYKEVKSEYFAMTDPDLDIPCAPEDFEEVLMKGFSAKHEFIENNDDIIKVGLNLKIDDLPEKSEDLIFDPDNVINHEKGYGGGETKKGLYIAAQLDTTFAIYKNHGPEFGQRREYSLWPSIRTAPPYEARHLPWYSTYSGLDEEDKYSEIESMLPVSGIDGTLKNIYRSETLRGQMRLKTGTLNGVRCLAGFITSKSGKEYRFVFMHNNFDEYDYNLRLFSTELLEMIIREEVN